MKRQPEATRQNDKSIGFLGRSIDATLDPVQFPNIRTKEADVDQAKNDNERHGEESAQNARAILFAVIGDPETALARSSSQAPTNVS